MPFDVLAIVLLPDHWHCVWTLPPGDDDFPARLAWLKSEFTRAYLGSGGRDWDVTIASRRHRRRGVWQPRYWEHRIRDEQDYYLHRDYIHLNPVKHGFVERPQDWPWSSLHRHVHLGWLDPNWPGQTPITLPEIQE